MATTLTAIRAALAANLSASIVDTQISAYMLANPTPPSIHLYPGGAAGMITYDLAMGRGLDSWPFTVQAFVGLTTDIGAQIRLDAYIAPTGAQSIKTALESDRTLGGAASDVSVVGCGGYRVFVVEGRPAVLGAEWHVTVLASGK